MVGASGYSPSRSRGNRIPYISNTSGTPGYRKNDTIFCKSCGHSMYKVQSLHALVCGNCGNMDDLPLTELEIQAKQQQESTFSIADGSVIYNPDDYSSRGLRHRKHYVSPYGINRRIPSIEDRLRDNQKSDAEKIMDFESNKMVDESYGSVKIISRIDTVNRSSDIIDGSDLIASKNNTDLSTSGGSKMLKPKGHKSK